MNFARPTLLKVGFLLVFWFSCFLLVFASNVKILKKIEVFSYKDSEQVRLEFNETFLRKPKINFESGLINIYLDSVNKDSQLPLEIISKRNSLIKSILTIQTPKTEFVHLIIKLNSFLEVLEEPIIQHSGRNLVLTFHNSKYKSPKLSSTEILIEEMEHRVKKDHSFPSTFSKVSKSLSNPERVGDISTVQLDDWGDTILTLVVSLGFVLLLIYLIAFLYNRFFRGRFSGMEEKITIRQLSSYHVGPKQKVIVFDLNGRQFACGVTPHSINLIAELFDKDNQVNLHSVTNEEKFTGKNFSQDLEKFDNTVESGLNKTKNNNSMLSENEIEVEISNEFDEKYKEVFLKNDTEQPIKTPEQKEKVGYSKSHKTSFSKTSTNPENMTNGNQMMIDFARNLTERLKFLKPIK